MFRVPHFVTLNHLAPARPQVRGETIPIRLFLGGFDLTPTFRDVNKKFSTRYYLNLVLIDEENRRYFKQQVRPSVFLQKCQVRLTRCAVVEGNHDIPDTRGMCEFAWEAAC